MASMLTSRGVAGHKTMAKAAVLPDSLVTLGQVLQAHGVATAAVVTNYNLAETFGFDRGFDTFDYLAPERYLGAPQGANRLAAYNLYRLMRERYVAAGRTSATFYRPAEMVNAQALAWLDDLGSTPFFLWLHYMEPHDPYFSVDGRSYARVAMPHPSLRDAADMQLAYRDGVGRFDAAFGALWRSLVVRGRAQQTLVVVVADHGEEFGAHGGFWHGTSLYEELVHIPLAMRGPGVTPGRTDALAQQIDLAPSIAAFLGTPVATSWEGHNLLDPAGQGPEVAVLQEDHEGHRLHAIRGGSGIDRFKHLTANADNPRGLPQDAVYDLRADPNETQPLSPERAATVERMLSALAAPGARRAAELGGPATERRRTLSPASKAELRALGYVQ
jgi:arylsulfatase A-like enzyme